MAESTKRIGGIHLLAALVCGLSFLTLIGLGMTSSESIAAEKDFRIGFLTSLKMECGQGSINAANMAIDEINSRGGLLGRKVKLYVADSESNPEKGILGLKRLVEKDKVNVLMGGAMSGVVLACMDYLQRYNKVFISTGVSSPEIGEKVSKNFERYKYQFRTVFNAADLAKFIVFGELAFMVKQGYTDFALLAEDAAWNRGLSGFIQTSLPEVGGKVVTTVPFDPQTKDFAPIFSKIIASKAQVAIPLLAHTDVSALFKQWNAMKAPFRMAGYNNSGLSEETWAITGGSCAFEVNVVYGSVIRTEITPKTIPFFDAYKERFKTSPHGCCSSTYDAVMVLADAISRAQSDETEPLIRALAQTDHVGILGRIVFDEKTHDAKFTPEYIPFLATQWHENGKRVVLWPEKFATGRYEDPPWLTK